MSGDDAGDAGDAGWAGWAGWPGPYEYEATELANKKNLFLNIERRRIQCYLTRMDSGR